MQIELLRQRRESAVGGGERTLQDGSLFLVETNGKQEEREKGGGSFLFFVLFLVLFLVRCGRVSAENLLRDEDSQADLADRARV